MAFSDNKLFIVNGLNKNKKKGVYITVVSLHSGKNIKEFLAVSLDHLKGILKISDRGILKVNVCERVKVDGDVLLLTISQGKDENLCF